MKDFHLDFSVLLVHVAAPCTAWMGCGQLRLFTSLLIMKRLHLLNEEIDTMDAVA